MKTTTTVAFNINDYAKVKLTPATLKLWRDNAERMRNAYPNHAELWPDTPKLDSEGYYRTQLWAIINLIGPECVAGGHPLDGGCIYLELPDSRAEDNQP